MKKTVRNMLALFVFLVLPAVAVAQGPATGHVEAATGVAVPATAVPATIAPERVAPLRPDLPLKRLPDGPVAPSFVTLHRTALNGKTVTVRGTVVFSLPPAQACPPGLGMCAQPRIILADKPGAGRNGPATLVVLLPENDKTPYATGEVVEVTGTVSAGPSGAVMHKS